MQVRKHTQWGKTQGTHTQWGKSQEKAQGTANGEVEEQQ